MAQAGPMETDRRFKDILSTQFFPAPHTDSVESFIDYRLPVQKFTPLAEVRWQRHCGANRRGSLRSLP